MFLDHLLWYFFNIIFFRVISRLLWWLWLCCMFWIRCSAYYGWEKRQYEQKKTVLFRPVNNRLKSVKFTKMFSVQCSMFQPCACVRADVYFHFITNTGFCVWCCVLCIFVLALLYQSSGIFFQIPYSWMVCFLICWQKHFLSLNRHQKA